MQNQLGADYRDPEARKRFLSDNCDRVEDLSYLKAYGAVELDQMKDDLSTVSIEINDLEEEKKEVLRDFSVTLKPKQEQRKQLLKELRSRSKQVKEQCYAFFDHDAGEVGYYNAEGQLVSQRTMRPQERQKTVFQSIIRDPSTTNRTGTDD